MKTFYSDMVRFNADSLRWAKNSIISVTNNDLFPKPFEIKVIDTEWDEIERNLLQYNIEMDGKYLDNEKKYYWSAGRKSLVPKGHMSFRFATQLDPIDSIVLTSLIHQYGDKLERSRIQVQDQKVFSNRFHPNQGFLFDTASNWLGFWERSLEKAREISGFVLKCDISDFYNQIYHHRLENELDKTGIPREITKTVIDLMSTLTDGVSRGIPVGPIPVHLLAEISLNSVDKSLESHFYDHCRYMDDFHIFCRSREDAQIALFDLNRLLDVSGRLTLQQSKVEIQDSEDFIETAEKKIAEATVDETESEIIKIILKHASGDPYGIISQTQLDDTEKEHFTEEEMTALLRKCTELDDPNYSKIRWILRRFSQIGAPGAIPFLLGNLQDLTPALADIALYLLSTEEYYEGDWDDVGKQLIDALEIPFIKHSEYLQTVLLHLFTKNPDLNHLETLLQSFDRSQPMVKRKIVLAAVKADTYHWIQERKGEINKYETWIRRALILGGSTLPKDEREYWMNRIIHHPTCTFLEKMVAKWVKKENLL